MAPYNRDEEVADLVEITNDLRNVHRIKSASYGDSWQKRGELVSVFGNLARKFDRLENLARDSKVWQDAIEGHTNEPIEDTVMDLAVYALLWCVYIKENRPEKYQQALKSATGDSNG